MIARCISRVPLNNAGVVKVRVHYGLDLAPGLWKLHVNPVSPATVEVGNTGPVRFQSIFAGLVIVRAV